MTDDEAWLVVRADAGPSVGTGHLMRSLALAQGWADAGGQVAFLTATQEERLLHRLQHERFQLRQLSAAYPAPEDWRETRKALREWPRAWVALDGYAFDDAYHRSLQAAGHPVLVLDDNAHLNRYDVDIVVNQNLHAPSLRYRTRADTMLLLGPEYVLLRREFRQHRTPRPPAPDVAHRVLVTLGGSDPMNTTRKVVEGLGNAPIEGLETEVVLGPDTRHDENLEWAVAGEPLRMHVLRDVANMAEVMARADLAVSGGGTTSWELAYMGVPNLSIVLAENQRNVVEALERESIAQSLGWHEDVTPGSVTRAVGELAHNRMRRSQMSEKGRGMVDGRGVERVVAALKRGMSGKGGSHDLL